MMLEDHLGDVIRKARTASQVDLDKAAQAAGLTAEELAAFEESGQPARKPNFAALAPLLDLSASKLERLLQGWSPRPFDPAVWHEFKVITTTGDGMTVNAYLVWDAATKEAALFDTGFDIMPVVHLLEEYGLSLNHLFITHSHEDHIAAVGPLRERFPYIHLHSNIKSAPKDQRNRLGQIIPLGNLHISYRETPGHCEDGVTYVIGGFPKNAPDIAIIGDCIFAGSMGRPNQSTEMLKKSVRTQIFSLPHPTLLCPGHGPMTTVGEEIDHNPFF